MEDTRRHSLTCLESASPGRQYGIVFLATILLASCSSLRLDYQLSADDGDWRTDGRSTHRDRQSLDAPMQLPLEQAWIYNAGGGFAEGSPLIVNNTVIVGTRKGEIHAVDLALGEQIGSKEFGRSIEGTPSVVDQVLYVPNAWGKWALSAFDLQSGVNRWRYEGVPIEAGILPAGDLVIVGDVEGNVIGLSGDTGQVQWLYEFGDFASILSSPVMVDDERAAIADETGRLALLDSRSGELIWRIDTGLPVEAALSSGNHAIYVPTTRGSFLAVDAKSGAIVWEYLTESDEVRFTGAAITNERIVFGGSDGILRSLDAQTGATEWTFHTDGTIVGAPVVNGDIVFVGAMDQNIYAIHRTNGSVQWEASLRGRVKSAPAVRNGFLVVLSEPRYVYAFANAANIRD